MRYSNWCLSVIYIIIVACMAHLHTRVSIHFFTSIIIKSYMDFSHGLDFYVPWVGSMQFTRIRKTMAIATGKLSIP